MLRSKGITTNHQIVDALKHGKKVLAIKDSLGVPEVLLLLLHSLLRLYYLHSREVIRVGEIFSNG